jgi:hypothetical protein
MPSFEDILESAREDIMNDNIDKLVSEIEFDEDLMYLNDPRAFGPDADEDDEALWNWEK